LSRAAAARLFLALSLCTVLAGCGPGPPPDPDAEDVAAARKDATARADVELGRAVEALGGKLVGTGSDDACYRGQNNWKVHDGYDHRCTVRRVAAVTFDGDFRRRIAGFDKRLFADGWGCVPSPCRDTNARLVEEYWPSRAAYYGPDFPISTLPTVPDYEKDGLHLDVQYAGADRAGRAWIEDWHRRRRGGVFDSFREPHSLDTGAVLRSGRDARYLVLLAVETDYFEK
jgi:hypothetical protein